MDGKRKPQANLNESKFEVAPRESYAAKPFIIGPTNESRGTTCSSATSAVERLEKDRMHRDARPTAHLSAGPLKKEWRDATQGHEKRQE